MNKRIWGNTILVLMGLYVLQLSSSGGLAFYIHPRYYTLAISAAVITLVVGILGILNTLRLYSLDKLAELDHDHHHDHHHHHHGDEEDHDHDHHTEEEDHDHHEPPFLKQIWELTKQNFWLDLFLALIIVLGFAVAPQQLSVRAASQRASASNIVVPDSNISIVSQFIDDREGYELGEWISATTINPELSEYVGQKVSVTGFVHVREGLESDVFMVSRFVVRCCVVDATPIGILAEYPGWDLDHRQGEWVKVSGEFDIFESESGQELIITVTGIDPASEPEVPYLY